MKSRIVKSHKEERKVIYNKNLGIIFNGEDNLRPYVTESLIDKSPTALQCSWIYASFLGGAGFEEDLSGFNISEHFWEKTTPDDLLYDVSESVSRHHGAAILVQYNALYQKEYYNVIPFSLCRVGKEDKDKYSGKVVVSPKGWGKRVKKEDLDVYDVYNPNPEIIQEQVEAAGGWDNYKGQILFFKVDNKTTYPKGLVETSYMFADVEYNLGLYYNSTVTRGFNDIQIIRHKKFESEAKEDAFVKDAKKVTGAENASSVWMIQDNWDDDRETSGNFRFDNIASDKKPARYAHFETSSSNYIRKCYRIPPQLIDFVAGKLGNTSGDDIRAAQSIYNALIGRVKNKISLLFLELFTNYKEEINSSNNWEINQYSLLKDGTVEGEETIEGDGDEVVSSESSEEEKLKKQSQATLKGSVGGVTAVLAVQSSVSQEITEYDAGLTILQEIFGFTEETSRKILGQPKIKTNDGDSTIN